MEEKWQIARKVVSNMVAYTNALVDTYKKILEEVNAGKTPPIVAVEATRATIYLFASDIIKEAKKVAELEKQTSETKEGK